MNEQREAFLKTFGKKIQEVRKGQGLSQEKLAHKAEVERSYMGRIERGESNPPIYTVSKILKALNLNLLDLF